jgi:hypothetical protein
VRTVARLAGLVLCCVAVSTLPAAAVDTSSPGSPQGNVTPAVQSATGVAAVAQSAPVDGRVALLLQNSTTKPVRIDLVTAVVISADGSRATKTIGVKAYPQIVAPDQLSLASVAFRAKAFAGNPNPKITVRIRSTAVSAARARQVLSVGGLTLSSPQTGAVAQTMQATLTNPTRAWRATRPEAAVMCFGEAGTPTTFASAAASARRVAPGASVPATVPLSTLCPTYLVAARAS